MSILSDSLSRRDVLKKGGLVLSGLAAAGMRPLAALGESTPAALRFGVMTDVHYADMKAVGTRHYRDSMAKMDIAVERLNRDDPAFTVELGDLIDAGDGTVAGETANLIAIEKPYARLTAPRHYVLGNHCLNMLTKDEFAAHCGLARPHYSFDQNGWHFVALDSCFNPDGSPYQRRNFNWLHSYIPDQQVQWLEADLAASTRPTVLFVHQRLDPTEHYSVKNRERVCGVLERAGNVVAVLQGHSHRNEHRAIRGIHYCVLRAMVEGPGTGNNAYGLVHAHTDGSLRIEGFDQQVSHRWTAEAQDTPVPSPEKDRA